MRQLRERLRSSWWGAILRDHDTEPTELAGGLMKLAIGGWLLSPVDTFGATDTWAVVSVLPEPLLGGILLAFGVFHLAALRGGRFRWRYAASLIGFVVWFVFGSTFAIANLGSTGVPIFLLAAFGQGWAAIRVWQHIATGDG